MIILLRLPRKSHLRRPSLKSTIAANVFATLVRCLPHMSYVVSSLNCCACQAKRSWDVKICRGEGDFWLPNVLLATAACKFWTALSPEKSSPDALPSLLCVYPRAPIYYYYGKKTAFRATPHLSGTSLLDWLPQLSLSRKFDF